MKTVLKADSIYMQNEDALQDWMFIDHIALQWYQSIYLHLYNEGLLKKISQGGIGLYVVILFHRQIPGVLKLYKSQNKIH